MKKPIKEYWDEFEKGCIPESISPEHVEFMKATFYAGASALMKIHAKAGDKYSIGDIEGARALVDNCAGDIKAAIKEWSDHETEH